MKAHICVMVAFPMVVPCAHRSILGFHFNGCIDTAVQPREAKFKKDKMFSCFAVICQKETRRLEINQDEIVDFSRHFSTYAEYRRGGLATILS